jgi:hypothetical protein
MPETEYSADDPQVQILAPLDEDPDATDVRLAHAKALLWRGLTDEEKLIVVNGELTLGQRRRRTMGDWLAIGHAIALLDEEVIRQAGAIHGRRYNKFWAELAPDQIKEMSSANRAHARWLWLNREEIQRWWDAQPANQRDKWGHPLTIKQRYERSTHIALTDPPRDEETGRPPPNPEATMRRRRAAQAALDEVAVRVDQSVDSLRDVTHDMEVITGRRVTPLHYDLSSPELIKESAHNFWQICGAQFGDEAIKHFAQALLAIVREHAAESYHPRRQRPQPPSTPRFTRGPLAP